MLTFPIIKISSFLNYYGLRWLCIVLIFITLPLGLSAQYQEAGAGVGGSLYYGDLSPDAVGSNLKLIRPSIGFFFNQHFNSRWGVKLSLNNMTLTGDDKNLTTATRSRNLSFRSNIWELALCPEINLLKFDPYEGNSFTIYMSAGVALIHHNPKAYYAGNWYKLQPLRTEGQGLASDPNTRPYGLYQFTVPITGGIKYSIKEDLNVFLEFGPRITFTDYLDDVSNKYANEDELRAAGGDIAVALSFRGNEIRTEPVGYPNLTQRGGAAVKDYYLNGLIGLSINFDNLFEGIFGPKVKCPKF